jgi:hypothetical protein
MALARVANRALKKLRTPTDLEGLKDATQDLGIVVLALAEELERLTDEVEQLKKARKK